MQQQRKLKQQFLRQNILDRNYDPQQFIVFLNIRLNIDSDIDRCDLQSLKNIVKEFLSQKENNIIQNVGSRLSSQNLISSKIDQKLTTIIFKQYNPPIVQDQFQTQVKCVKLNNKYTQEQMLKIQCEVKNPERKYSGGLMGIGATSFLQFQVETFGLGWSVGRRYSDFIWLRNTLKKLYPSLIIPPIPNKKASKRLPRQIEKRMRILSLFLNDLVGLPEIFNCRYVQGFLSQKDNSKFEQLKKQGESKPIFQSINSTETLSGTIKINLSNHNKDYVKNLKQFVQKSEVLYKEVTRASKRLQSLKIDEVNQLYQMGNKFAELYETGREFQNKSKSTGISKLTEIYIKLNNMMIEWGNNMKNEIQLLQINCNTFFKYSRQSYIGFHQLFQKLTQQENLFLQNKFKLDARKEKIFLFHDPNKWEISKKEINFIPKSSIHQRTEAFKIMLPKESLENQKNKMNYSYYLTRLFDKSQEYFNKQAQKFNENFKQFSIKSKVNNQQLGQNWSEMCLIYSEGESRVKKLKQMQKISQYQQSQVAYDD